MPGAKRISTRATYLSRCAECRRYIRRGHDMHLWFEPREWLHPGCVEKRLAPRREWTVFDAAEFTVGILTDLHDVDIEWEAPGT